jgi:hypothetical protein
LLNSNLYVLIFLDLEPAVVGVGVMGLMMSAIVDSCVYLCRCFKYISIF